MSKLYRVLSKTTHSLQPGAEYNSTWEIDVHYIGPGVEPARIAYHTSRPQDVVGGHGGKCRMTIFEILNQDGLEDDDPGLFKEIEFD